MAVEPVAIDSLSPITPRNWILPTWMSLGAEPSWSSLQMRMQPGQYLGYSLVRPWSREPAQQASPTDPQKCKMISSHLRRKFVVLHCTMIQNRSWSSVPSWPPASSSPRLYLLHLPFRSALHAGLFLSRLGMLTSRAAPPELSCPGFWLALKCEVRMLEKAGEGELRLLPARW